MSDRLKRILGAVVTANTATVTVLAFVLSVVIGGIMMILSDQHLLSEWGYVFSKNWSDAPTDSWHKVADGYTAMFHGAIYDPHAKQALRPLETTVVDATPLVFAGLAVAVPFRAGLFNIGAQSQLIGGAIFATWVGFTVSAPMPVTVLLVILAGMAGGAVVAGLIGVLKTRFGAHEVISSIMLNNIALGVLAWLIKTKAFHDPARQDAISKPVKSNALLPAISGSSPEINLSTLLAIVAMVAVWWLMTSTTLGFRLRALGSNPDAARTAGISVSRNQVYAMLLAGALMGLVAVTQVNGTLSASHAMTATLDNGFGFTGITVALLGRGTPIGVAGSALLFGALTAGGGAMEAATTPTIPHDVVTVVQAVIVIFVAAPKLVQEIFRLRDVKRNGHGTAPSIAPASKAEVV
jgi:simple sugar transport system permease protein